MLKEFKMERSEGINCIIWVCINYDEDYEQNCKGELSNGDPCFFICKKYIPERYAYEK